MAQRSGPRTSRLVVLLLGVALATGLATTVVSAGSLPPCRIADVTATNRAYSDWGMTLLDTTYRLPRSYVPPGLQSTANAGLNGGQRVRTLVIADLRAMARAARAAGARLAVQSAYRSYATQVSTFEYWTRVSGYSAALKSSARAGHSEHQLGTTLDFRSYGGAAPWYYKDWGSTKAGTWLRRNAWKYGFVMSYPKGKYSVTCYSYEPWHFRYVGRATAAAIRASGLTLREYLWHRHSPPPPPTPSVDPSASPAIEPSPPVDESPAPVETPITEPNPPAEPSPAVEPSPAAPDA